MLDRCWSRLSKICGIKLIRLAIILVVLTALGYWQARGSPIAGGSGLLCSRGGLPDQCEAGIFAAVVILARFIYFLIWDAFAFYVTPYGRRTCIPVVVAACTLCSSVEPISAMPW